MKYLQTFELYTKTGNYVDYEVGDIVVCFNDKIENLKPTKHNSLKNGDKYKVLNLYTSIEYKMLGRDLLVVDVENLKTGEITKGWEANRFKLEFEFDAGKYNI